MAETPGSGSTIAESFAEVSKYSSPERDTPRLLAIAPHNILAYREGLYVRCRMEKTHPEPEKVYEDRRRTL